MAADSPFGQVISLSAKRLVEDVPLPAGGGAVLRDVLSGGPFDAAVTGFVLSCLPGGAAPVLWVSDRMSRRENGRLYGAALRHFGFAGRVLRVEVSHPRDVLWAMEEGASCAGLGAVVGEIHGAPEVLSFTATKRLALRAEAAGVPVWLIRSGDPGALSAARERWRLGSLPSRVHPDDPQAPGHALWEAELFRARGRSPGTWEAAYDPAAREPADRLRLVSRAGDGSLAEDRRPAQDAAG
jgi:protein ImuA